MSTTVPRILLVDDSANDAELIQRELRRAGVEYTGQHVETQAALTDALRDFSPDIVLSDHSLQGFTGRDVLQRVRMDRRGTPVVIVTGSIDEETAADYILAGAVDYVVKHRLFRLSSAVRRALALRRAVDNAALAEEARTRSERRFRKLVEYASDVIALLDSERRITYTTQSIDALGYEVGELEGTALLSLVHPDDRAAAENLLQEALALPGTAARSAFRLPHKDGSWRDVLVVGANHLGDGVIDALVLSFHDVTERRRAAAALRELEEQRRQEQKMEAIGRVASGVAHDFNNVLMVITACSEILLLELAEDATARPEALEIRKAADRAATLTRQLLAFSREMPIVPKLVDLNGLVGNMAGMLHHLLGNHVRYSVIAAGEQVFVWADPGQLEQVVTNLAVNARDAMPSGGDLTITIGSARIDDHVAAAAHAQPGEYAVLEARDSGTGMSDETRARLFEPFFTTKPKGQGTGLGLATVYGIVQQAGGFVRVESTPGVGSTFVVCLPRSVQRSGSSP